MIKQREDYELINGKPHFSEWFGSASFLHESQWFDEEVFERIKAKVLRSVDKVPSDLVVKDSQTIIRPPIANFNPLNCNGSIAIKFKVWGRAFKVKRIFRQPSNKVRYVKKIVSGRRKRVKQ
jgi:hypothetical protein